MPGMVYRRQRQLRQAWTQREEDVRSRKFGKRGEDAAGWLIALGGEGQHKLLS